MVARLLFVLTIALAAAGCETSSPAPPPRSALEPGPVIRGGRLAQGPFTPLHNPIAVAASGPDLYVVDAALGLLVRVDPVSMVMVQFASRPFAPRTRLAAAPDGSLYVLDPVGRRILRFTRDGRLATTYAADATVASLVDIALDPARGRLVAVDSLNRQLVAFHPLAPAFELLPVQSGSLDAIAIGRDAVYAIDGRCACLARITFDGVVRATFGQGLVQRPERLAADLHGRIFVYDRADRALKVFRGERLVETIELARFGLTEATDVAHADGWLYVADGPGAQVRMLRVQPPARSGE